MRRTCVALALALLLSACGENSEPKKAADQPATTTTTASEPTAKVRTARCTLKGSKPARVTVVDTGAELLVTFKGQPVAASGTTGYFVTVNDETGDNSAQLGMKFLDGEAIGYFVFDFGTSKQTNLDGTPDVSGSVVNGVFPYDELGAVGDGGIATWNAAFSLDGNDVGLCPTDYESQPFPG